MVIKGAILDIQRVKVLEVWVLLPVRQVALQIGGVLFKSYKLGVEVVEDVFGVEISERWQVIFFVVIGGGHRRGAGRSESVSVFHGCCLSLLFEGGDFFSKRDGVFFYKSSEWWWHESGFVWVPRNCLQWDIPSI